MKNFLLITMFGLLLLSCNNSDDEVTLLLETSGSTTLTFTNGSDPIADAEIRVAYGGTSTTFETGNIFEEFTDENGNIQIGPLNSGSYQFRLSVGSQEYLYESFDIVSNQTTSKSFELESYRSSATFEVVNTNDIPLLNYYLVPSNVSISTVSSEDIISQSYLGSVSSQRILFESILSGTYALVVYADDEFTTLESDIYVSRDYEIQGEVLIPEILLVTGSDWVIQSTTDYYSGEEVDNAIFSFDFSADNTYVVNFGGGISYNGNYSYYGSSSITIYLDFPGDPLIGVYFFNSVRYTSEGQLIVDYYDYNYDRYLATFE